MRELKEFLRLAGRRPGRLLRDGRVLVRPGRRLPHLAQGLAGRPRRLAQRLPRNGIKPGLWFGTNTLVHLNAPRRGATRHREGRLDGALPRRLPRRFHGRAADWYDRGIRLFKLDFADFDAAAKGDETRLSLPRLRQRNRTQLSTCWPRSADATPSGAGRLQRARRRCRTHGARCCIPMYAGSTSSTRPIPAIRALPMCRK